MPVPSDHSKHSTLRLTTLGRKSGKERVAEVWFVVDDGAVILQAGAKGAKGWLGNLSANPDVRLEIGTITLRGRAQVLSAEERERVAALFRRKYWLARIARFVGSQIGRGTPVRIELTGE